MSRDIFRRVNPGPRVRMAARLYATGAVKTKKAACEAVGLHPQYLSILTRAGNPQVNSIISEIDRALSDETVSASRLLALLSREALRRMRELIASDNEHVALRASSDILDRAPETSKNYRATVTAWNLTADDAKTLARSLVEAARVKEQYQSVAAGDFVRVSTEVPSDGQTSQPVARLQGDSSALPDAESEEDAHSAPRPDGEERA